MSNRDTIEEKRIRKSIKEQKAKGRDKKKKRNIQLAIICSIFSIVVILGAAYIIVHSISKKESYRKEGITAYKEGNYVDALTKFDASLNETQWFSTKMDQDTRFYIAACYMRTDSYDKALDTYRSLKDDKQTVISKDKLEEYINLSSSLNEVKNGNINDSFIATLEQEYNRGNTSIALFLGSCYQKQEKYDEMVNYYNIYIDKYGMNTYLAYQLSTYYLNNDNLDAAIPIINQGLSAEDDLYLDKVKYNDCIVSEKQMDYEGALSKVQALVQQYPNDETYKREYDFLNSRININPEPVHTEGDADVTY